MFEFSQEEMAVLEKAAKSHPDAHVRSRALAVRAVAVGNNCREVSAMFPFSAYSIGQWVREFHEHGLSAFVISGGRGRHSSVDEQEVLSRLRRSPSFFGVDQSRWTLKALRQACPSLAEMTDSGVLQVLHRLGFSYKRGQAWIHSPDPLYEQKKTPSSRPIRRHSKAAKKRSS